MLLNAYTAFDGHRLPVVWPAFGNHNFLSRVYDRNDDYTALVETA